MTAAQLPEAPDLPLERRRPGSPMRETVAGPLWVLGPPRSSQTLLATALAQHPALRLVLDTSWVPPIGAALSAAHAAASLLGQRSAIAAAEVSRTDLLAAVGTALGGLLPPGGARVAGSWVSSAAVTSPHDVTSLLELFPTARVVHLLRHPDAVVESLSTQACGDGRYASPASGYRSWTESVAALIDAEHTHGSDRVLRLTVAGLHGDPDGALARCLGHLGLPPHAPCAAVLRSVTPDPVTAPPRPDDGASFSEERATAVRCYDELVGGAGQTSDDPVVAALRTAAGRPVPTHDPARTVGAGAGAGTHPVRPYQQLVALAVPPSATAAVVSKGDPVLVDVPGRRCWHLPRTADGRYGGYHPADSAEALTHLRSAISAGARYLIVPGPSAWWLVHYPGLADHLRTRARLVACHEDIATVYALTSEDTRP